MLFLEFSPANLLSRSFLAYVSRHSRTSRHSLVNHIRILSTLFLWRLSDTHCLSLALTGRESRANRESPSLHLYSHSNPSPSGHLSIAAVTTGGDLSDRLAPSPITTLSRFLCRPHPRRLQRSLAPNAPPPPEGSLFGVLGTQYQPPGLSIAFLRDIRCSIFFVIFVVSYSQEFNWWLFLKLHHLHESRIALLFLVVIFFDVLILIYFRASEVLFFAIFLALFSCFCSVPISLQTCDRPAHDHRFWETR